MSTQTLSAFERGIIAGLAYKAGLAATILEVWSRFPVDSVQSVRSLVDMAQLGVTEEKATQELLYRARDLRIVEAVPNGFRPNRQAYEQFARIALALNAIEFYKSAVHRDATVAQVVLTKPPRPSILEQKLGDQGWRISELEQTNHAFKGMVRAAQRRLVVMTPFFDAKGASWLQELFSSIDSRVERTLVLRSLEDPARRDYPAGYNSISDWLKMERIKVFNYSIPRVGSFGRETFHAKVVLCDRSTVYLGSSNMNAASLDHSMEMGVVLQGSAAANTAEVVEAVLASATQWL